MMKTNIRCYSELISIPTYDERFKYLQLNGVIGSDTFGFDRYINQKFYRSIEWKQIRNQIILRDQACDLGHPDYPIQNNVYIHHMNPIDVSDISDATDYLLNPEYLICVSLMTHNAIHYGFEEYLDSKKIIERRPNDTCLWNRR